MRQIIDFFVRNKNFILFIFLFSVSLTLLFTSSNFHKSYFLNSTNLISGNIYELNKSINDYFNLSKINESLSLENKNLRESLYNLNKKNQEYKVFNARIIKNSYSLNNNFLTINIGNKDSIKTDMGVVSSKGVIGITDRVSDNYSRVISILNTNLNINAKLNNTNYFGVLNWDGKNLNVLQLNDLPKQTSISIGDTIITGGNSLIFPMGIPIGIVTSYKLDNTQNYIEARIKLFNDMTNLSHAYIIKNHNKKEIIELNE